MVEINLSFTVTKTTVLRNSIYTVTYKQALWDFYLRQGGYLVFVSERNQSKL